jgi:GAF domain-containing protein
MDRFSRAQRFVQSVISLQDTSDLPKMILVELVECVKAEIACFYVPTASEEMLTASAVHPEDLWVNSAVLISNFMTRDQHTGGIGKALREKVTLLITNTEDAELQGDYIPFFQDVTSEIIVPVFEGEDLVAVLVASRRALPAFSLEDKIHAELIAGILNLVHRVQQERMNREAEKEFLRSIAQIDTDHPDSIFGKMLESVGAFLPSRFISLWLFNPLDETLVIRGFYPPAIGRQRISFDQFDTVLSLDSCLSSQTIREQHPQRFRNIQNDPQNANSAFARMHDLQSFISFPVIGEDRRVLAIVNVYPHGDSEIIADEDIDATAILLSQLAPKLALSRMKRRESMLAVYGKICRRVRDDHFTQASWDALAIQISLDMKCEACSIFLFDNHSGNLVLRGSTGIEGDPEYTAVKYQVGEGLTGLAFKRQTPIVYYRDLAEKFSGHHISKHREKLRTGEKSRSILAQAIVREEGDAIGVIRCNNKNQTPRDNCGRFSEEDTGVIQMIGTILSEYL